MEFSSLKEYLESRNTEMVGISDIAEHFGELEGEIYTQAVDFKKRGLIEIFQVEEDGQLFLSLIKPQSLTEKVIESINRAYREFCAEKAGEVRSQSPRTSEERDREKALKEDFLKSIKLVFSEVMEEGVLELFEFDLDGFYSNWDKKKSTMIFPLTLKLDACFEDYIDYLNTEHIPFFDLKVKVEKDHHDRGGILFYFHSIKFSEIEAVGDKIECDGDRCTCVDIDTEISYKKFKNVKTLIYCAIGDFMKKFGDALAIAKYRRSEFDKLRESDRKIREEIENQLLAYRDKNWLGTVKMYKWTWCVGTIEDPDDEGTRCQHEHIFSLEEPDWIDPNPRVEGFVPGVRQIFSKTLILPRTSYPYVEEIFLRSFEDFKLHFPDEIKSPYISIKGVRVDLIGNKGYLNYGAKTDVHHRFVDPFYPPDWMCELLGIPNLPKEIEIKP